MPTGFCHSDCTITTAFSTNEDVDFLTICKQCHGKALAQNAICNESPTSPLHLQVPEYQNLMTATKSSRSNLLMTASKGSRSNISTTATKSSRANLSMTASKGARSNCRAQDTRLETKQVASESSSAVKSRRKSCSWGIIWKKIKRDASTDASANANADTSANFRLNNILLRGGLGVHRKEPECRLCRKPYRPDLMYICCEVCKSMFIQTVLLPYILSLLVMTMSPFSGYIFCI